MKRKKSSHKSVYLLALSALVISLIWLGFSIYPPLQRVSINEVSPNRSEAGILFKPGEISLPSSEPVVVQLQSAEPVTEADIFLLFDPSMIELNRDIAPSDTFLDVVEMTSRSEANVSGEIHLHVALSPDQLDEPKSGTLDLARLYFKARKQKAETYIELDSTRSSILTPEDSSLGSTALRIELH